MANSSYEALDEALEALAGSDIALKNGNSNHAPMVAEALCTMGRPQAVMPWIARYEERLLPRPPAGDPLRAENWRSALGQRDRFADWAEFFGEELRQRPWPEMLDGKSRRSKRGGGRRSAVHPRPARHEDFLIVSGLAGTSRDVAALTRDGAHTYTMAGAMGGACMIGLGLALARPDKRGLVVTGDGELLMNVGALATIAVMNPANLAIVCVDNGHYGETGYQKSHTSLGVDLEKIAAGSGIRATRAIASQEELADGPRLLREGNGTTFVLLRVKPTDPPAFKRNMDPSACRNRFRTALLGDG